MFKIDLLLAIILTNNINSSHCNYLSVRDKNMRVYLKIDRGVI